MQKVLWKIRGLFIKILASDDMTVIINAKLDSNKGIIVGKYNLFKNIDIEGFNQPLTVEYTDNTK